MSTMDNVTHAPVFDGTAVVGPHFCLSFPPLSARGVVHGFMLKSSDTLINDGGERERFLRSLSARDMIVMAQEHGNTVHVVEKGERPASGDGLVMVERGVIGVIKTADCLPVILYGTDEPVAAVVHAGWRGTVKGITENALRLLVARGAPPEKIRALIGPGIGPCCYNVGEDVADEFRKAGFTEEIFLRKGDTLFLDLKKANRELIERAGVREIHDVGLCTACLPGLFHSARRDRGTSRQISFVLLP